VAPDAFVHWVRFGSQQGQSRLVEQTLTDRQARIPFREAARAMLPIAVRADYDFTTSNPVCTVVIPVRDNFAAAMAAIAALGTATREAVELLIIDNASTDETRALDRYVRGARLVRFDDDIGSVQAANAGWQLAATPYVLFLSADARLAPGALDRARRRLEADETIAAVAALLLRPLGTIEEAGGIVWSDGGVHAYQSDASPLAPEANFVRDVDFGSLACLLVRRSALDAVGGLDPDLSPAYAAADLGLRLASAGLRVVYDPSVLAFHDETDEQPGPPVPSFLERHTEVLARKPARGGMIQVFARHTGLPAHRLLFVDDTVPLRRLGSGFVRSNDLVCAMAQLGCAVTVYPINGCPHDPAHVFGDMPETAEVMHTHAADRLKAFLEGRPGYYDTIWVCRAHNLDRIRDDLSQLRAMGALTARLVLDTEAVTPYRDSLRARLANQAFDLEAAMRQFAASGEDCDATVAVTDAEAATLRAHGLPRVTTIGHMIQSRPTRRIFAERVGMLFVGAIHTQDSPNYDSLVWLIHEVLPRVEAAIGWKTQLSVAGYMAPGINLNQFESHPRVRLCGPIADLTGLYDRHRVFVAPTRFAAGAPYKVLEAGAMGLPVVATDLLAEELGWRNGGELLSAPVGDAAAFAEAVLAVHETQDVWEGLRSHALERLAADCGSAGFVSAVRDVLALNETNV
jgi:GT2 family glycosyltransferase